jgi:hypothetical protein
MLQVSQYLTSNYTIEPKLYYWALVTKTAWCWSINRHKYQENRIEDTKICPPSCSHLSFDKGAKYTYWKKDRLFNKRFQEHWIFTCRILKLDPYL